MLRRFAPFAHFVLAAALAGCTPTLLPESRGIPALEVLGKPCAEPLGEAQCGERGTVAMVTRYSGIPSGFTWNGEISTATGPGRGNSMHVAFERDRVVLQGPCTVCRQPAEVIVGIVPSEATEAQIMNVQEALSLPATPVYRTVEGLRAAFFALPGAKEVSGRAR